MNIPANFRLLYIRQINIARKFEERSIISARPRAEQWNDILGRRQIHIWPRCLLAPHWLQNEVPGACAAFIWSICGKPPTRTRPGIFLDAKAGSLV